MKRKWKTLLQDVTWASPRFGRLHSQKPSDMGISFSHHLSGLRVRVRVTGDAHVTRVLGMGMPICISLWLHAKMYALPLPSFFPFCCRARAFSISRTRLSPSLEQASFHDLEPRHHFIPRLQLHRKTCSKILFSIMRLFITAFLQSHTHEYLLRTVVELNTAWESKLLSKTKPIQWK